MKKAFPLRAILFFGILLSGCAGIVQKGGALLEGSAFEEKTLAVYRSSGIESETVIELKKIRTKNSGEILEITSSAWPGFSLRGNTPSGRSGGFDITEARFLSTHVQGWNEFTLALLGRAVFICPGGEVGNFRVEGEVERVQISSGKIRLKSSRLGGEAALAPLRNRRERILVLAEWMLKVSPPEDSPLPGSLEEFEAYWTPLLFPELVSEKERPRKYSRENAEWSRADSIKWNTAYTADFFPEELWEARNSGALLRDWEEALPWIRMEYSWDNIIASMNQAILYKIN